ncbi:MAG: hypothetical protein GY801_35770 [bacterium]|nr:hypothetical protein [bacterium]
MKYRFVKVFGTVTMCIAMLATIALAAHHAPRMTKETLKVLLDDPDAKVTIIDVRSKTQWEKSTLKVKDAVWENPADFTSWADFTYARNQQLVLYCA